MVGVAQVLPIEMTWLVWLPGNVSGHCVEIQTMFRSHRVNGSDLALFLLRDCNNSYMMFYLCHGWKQGLESFDFLSKRQLLQTKQYFQITGRTILSMPTWITVFACRRLTALHNLRNSLPDMYSGSILPMDQKEMHWAPKAVWTVITICTRSNISPAGSVIFGRSYSKAMQQYNDH